MDRHDSLPYYKLSVEDTLQAVGSRHSGLTQKEARRRSIAYSSQTPQTRELPKIAYFGRRFVNPFALLLIGCALISYRLDSSRPALLFLLSGLLYYVSDGLLHARPSPPCSASTSVQTAHVTVLRDHLKTVISSGQLLPGDIVLLHKGDIVPADIRLLETSHFITDSEALFGVSTLHVHYTQPIVREVALTDQGNMAFLGSRVIAGHARGVVTAISDTTELGHRQLLQGTTSSQGSALETELAQFNLWALAIMAIVVLLITCYCLFAGVLITDIVWLNLAMVSAFVANGLIIEVALVMWLTFHRLPSVPASLRNLSTLSELAHITDIIVDTNELFHSDQLNVDQFIIGRRKYGVTVDAPSSSKLQITPATATSSSVTSWHDAELFFAAAIMPAGEALVGLKTLSLLPAEAAFIKLAKSTGLDPYAWNKSHHELRHYQFDPDRQRATTVRQIEGQIVALTRGDTATVLNKSTALWDEGQIRPLSASDRSFYHRALAQRAKQGQECMGLAYRVLPSKTYEAQWQASEVEHSMVFLGVISWSAPMNEVNLAALDIARRASLGLFFIQPDRTLAASSVTSQLQLPATALMNNLQFRALNDTQALRRLRNSEVLFTDFMPSDTHRLIHVMKKAKRTVAISGPSLCNAPAPSLIADEGIGGVLLGMQKARRVVQVLGQVSKIVGTAMASETTLIGFGVLSIALLHIPPALLPAQILTINVGVMVLPLVALSWDYFSPLDSKQTAATSYGFIKNTSLGSLLGFGLLAALLSYANYLTFFIRHHLSPTYIDTHNPLYIQATTLTMMTLILCLYVYIFFERADAHKKFFTADIGSNKHLLVALSGSLIILIGILSSSFLRSFIASWNLGLTDWITALAAAFLFGLLRLTHRHTRQHSRKAVLELHASLHKQAERTSR